MKRTLLATCLPFFMMTLLIGQNKPPFLPNQLNDSSELGVKCYCKPGIANQSRSRGLELSYILNGRRVFDEDGSNLQDLNRTLRSYELNFKFKVPIINTESVKLLMGYGYNQERYRVEELGVDHSLVLSQLNNVLFKVNSLNALFSKSFNHKNYLALRANFVLSGNYDRFFRTDSSHSYYNLIAFWGIKVNEDFEWGIGLRIGKNINENTQLIPILLVNKNLSKNWGFKAALPAYIYLRHNFNPRLWLFFGTEFSSQNYRFNFSVPNNLNQSFVFDRSNVRFYTNVEFQISNWVLLDIKGGYNLPFDNEFTSNNEDVYSSFNTNPSSHPFLRVGFFISPPNNFLK